MARSYAPIFTSIWSDPDFTSRTAEAQRGYLLAVSQSNISYAGVISFTARRWARMASNTTVADIEKIVQELEHSRFIVVDEDSEEILVRSFVRHNGVLAQPQLKKAMDKAYGEILSAKLRCAFLAELPDADRNRLLAAFGHPAPNPAGTLPAGEPVDNDEDTPPDQHHRRSEPLAHPAPDPASSLPAPSPPAPGQEPEPEPVPEPSSSSSTAGRTAPCEEEDGDDVLDQALAIIVPRVLALRVQAKGPVTDPEGWIAKVTRTRRARHADTTTAWLAAHPDGTADELAAHLEPDIAPRRAPRFDPSCANCHGLTWIETDDGMAPCPHCRPKRPGTTPATATLTRGH